MSTRHESYRHQPTAGREYRRPDHVRWVALVLDTSAVLAYAAESMHVHEPVLLAGEACDDATVPVLCLIDAVRRDPGVDLRDLLHAEQVLTVMPDRHTDLLADWTVFLDGREDAEAVYRHSTGLL